jgi:hypothetical protein
MSTINDSNDLLDRSSFRTKILKRDGSRCVICGYTDTSQLDVHHILERRLWDDGGYYDYNGATLCDDHNGTIGCHRKAEMTIISCDEIRFAAQILTVIIPDHLYRDYNYDKWGNILNPDGTRTKGELFYDESVQIVLKAGGVLSLFQKYVKYPRTLHLNWSPGLTDDDRVLPSTDVFAGKEVVMTEKVDGECTTMYHDYIHARSIDSGNHPSRGWVKNLHGQIQGDIPPNFRLCGENLYAEHSIHYDNLPSYFMLFSIWDENNMCLSWDETLQWAELLGLEMVPTLYRGPWDEAKIRQIESKLDLTKTEGYTVRITDSFAYGSFRKSIAKFVRKGHVISTHNWMMKAVVKNSLHKDACCDNEKRNIRGGCDTCGDPCL